MSSDLLGVSGETWETIGNIATGGGFLLAGLSAMVAAGQLWYTRQSRLDQNRPYVVLTFEQGRTLFNLVDILIRNVGAGPAYDVRISIDPPLQRAKEVDNMPIAGARYFNEPVPLMPPGYELRTFFDDMRERQEGVVPNAYTVTLEYHDGHGHSWKESSVQDLDLMNDLLFGEIYEVHHAAKALREISKLLGKSPLLKGDLDVTTETRETRVERKRAEHQAWKERIAAHEAERATATRSEDDAEQET